jgi:hypothetical protein
MGIGLVISSNHIGPKRTLLVGLVIIIAGAGLGAVVLFATHWPTRRIGRGK